MGRVNNLFEYKIIGEGIHCSAKIYICGVSVGSIDLSTKYTDTAEEELAEIFKDKILKSIPEFEEDDEE